MPNKPMARAMTTAGARATTTRTWARSTTARARARQGLKIWLEQVELRQRLEGKGKSWSIEG